MSRKEHSEAILDGARLAALRELDLLDRGPDPAMERLTRLVTNLLGVPVSLVSLIDSDRQYFAGQQGLEGEWARLRQTPLSHSICQHAVAGRTCLSIADARRDPLVRDNLAVRDLGVVAYAGVPLLLDDGHAVGALCAIDGAPHKWSGEDLRILQDLAATAVSLLDLRAELARQALHDRLTGLPNRRFLLAMLEQELPLHDGEEEAVALICLGLDHTHQINQALGTAQADAVLVSAAARLREAAGPEHFVGRLRGDTFAVVAPGAAGEIEALDLASRLREALLEAPLELGESEVSLGATVGVAIGRAGDNGPDVVSQAAEAMRRGKRRRGSINIALDDWSREAAEQLRKREALRGAAERDEVTALYQPIVDLRSGGAVAFEALARWDHPALGRIAPGDFIGLAEATSDIVPIGERLIAAALAQVRRWRVASGLPLRVNVNVSPVQLDQPNFAERVGEQLGRAGLPGEALGIEITESAILEPGPVPQRNLAGLQELGTPLILDDFGTGYSALGYLRHIPVDAIKLDRSFVAGIGEDERASAIVVAVFAMAAAMGIEVVAEGIETVEQSRRLGLMGCTLGQGFLFSPPLPVEELSGDFHFGLTAVAESFVRPAPTLSDG